MYVLTLVLQCSCNAMIQKNVFVFCLNYCYFCNCYLKCICVYVHFTYLIICISLRKEIDVRAVKECSQLSLSVACLMLMWSVWRVVS